jgi:uncharacterized integral membrane protein (TIGR00698 family)
MLHINLAMSTLKKPLTEDWTSVLIGFSIILLSIGGLLIKPANYNWSNLTDLQQQVFVWSNIQSVLLIFLFTFALVGTGFYLMGKTFKQFALGFPAIFLLNTAALILTGNEFIRYLNLEAVIISLGLGLLIGNFVKLPEWIRSALSTELFVKIGLILLGSGIVFGDILKAGSFGLVQALLVVISVWYFAYWLCKKLKIDEELTLMLASAVSICGVSAAIATAGAIKGDPKKLSYVVSLVLITAIPMMIGMPYLARAIGLSQEVTGAWLGGTIDTTGAVVASGTLVGETALKISTIVKFSQNVLLGLAAFVISVYWSYSKDGTTENTEKPSLSIIWQRFPKFVLGFLAASILFSFIISPETTSLVKGNIKNLQTVWFSLAFVSIGLETRFSDLFKQENRKPMGAFLIAQLFNIVVTLLIASLLF